MSGGLDSHLRGSNEKEEHREEEFCIFQLTFSPSPSFPQVVSGNPEYRCASAMEGSLLTREKACLSQNTKTFHLEAYHDDFHSVSLPNVRALDSRLRGNDERRAGNDEGARA